MTAQTPAIDPVTIEVVRHRLRSICEQIETNIVRTAYSILIYEYKEAVVVPPRAAPSRARSRQLAYWDQ